MLRLLVVEDEEPIQMALRDILVSKGYAVDVARRGDEGLRRALAEEYELILLDVMLPAVSGFDILRKLRGSGRQTPVILLTARQTELDKVVGFELGVDDYVVKPFSMLELLGRIQAVLRRTQKPRMAESDVLHFGKVSVDVRAYRVTHPHAVGELPARAYDILRVLARHEGEAVSREILLREIWGEEELVNERTVDNLVVKLRRAIEENAESPRYLVTVHGVGYRLDTDDRGMTKML